MIFREGRAIHTVLYYSLRLKIHFPCTVKKLGNKYKQIYTVKLYNHAYHRFVMKFLVCVAWRDNVTPRYQGRSKVKNNIDCNTPRMHVSNLLRWSLRWCVTATRLELSHQELQCNIIESNLAGFIPTLFNQPKSPPLSHHVAGVRR